MPESLKHVIKNAEGATSAIIKETRLFFDRIDAAYKDVAEKNGFVCRGCEDNCCYTLFYHYTVVEYLYIHHGIKTLAVPIKDEILKRAADYLKKEGRLNERGEQARLICPANMDQKCQIYPFRPMICRLHGICHEFTTPAGTRIKAPGCDTFSRVTSGRKVYPLDRTEIYREMAGLEQKARRMLGLFSGIKMTVARILAG